MATRESGHSMTLRIPEQLYMSVADAAKERNQSVNSLVQESLRKTISEIEQLKRFDEYTLLGQDEDSNVDYAMYAQAEVMLNE